MRGAGGNSLAKGLFLAWQCRQTDRIARAARNIDEGDWKSRVARSRLQSSDIPILWELDLDGFKPGLPRRCQPLGQRQLREQHRNIGYQSHRRILDF